MRRSVGELEDDRPTFILPEVIRLIIRVQREMNLPVIFRQLNFIEPGAKTKKIPRSEHSAPAPPLCVQRANSLQKMLHVPQRKLATALCDILDVIEIFFFLRRQNTIQRFGLERRHTRD
jgi:hypothetical protein